MRSTISWVLLFVASFLVTAPAFAQKAFQNLGGAITLNDNSQATPYPSTNKVQDAFGILEKVTVSLNGVSHGYPDDMDIILVGPDGTKSTLISDAGGQFDLVGASFILDSDAGSDVPNDTAISNGGTYKPHNWDGGDNDTFPAADKLAGGDYGTLAGDLSAFAQKTANGEWYLFAKDDQVVDAGSIQSWTLNVYTTPILGVDNSATITFDEDTSKTINLKVDDFDTALSGLTLSATSNMKNIIPDSGLTFGGNTGGTNRTLTITPAANANGGPVEITITVKDPQGLVVDGTNQKKIVVQVTPKNDAPTMIVGTGSTTITQGGISTNIIIHLQDVDSAPDQVVLTATSSNPTIMPATNVLFRTEASTPAGTNRTVQIAALAATGSSTITIIATDPSGDSTTATINVTVTAVPTVVAANPTAIVVPDSGAASPYASTITVPNLANLGKVAKAVVSLINVEHSNPADLGVLLVSPSGQKVVLMRATGGGSDVGIGDGNDVRLTFDADASANLSSAALVTSTNKATDLGSGDFPAPAPASTVSDPYVADLTALRGSDASGVWSLYVYDTTGNSSSGKIAGGWVLQIYAAPVIASIGTQTTTEDKPISVSFSAADFDGVVTNVTATSGNTTVIPNGNITPNKNGVGNIGDVNGLTSGTFTFSPAANQNGSVTVTLEATDNQNYKTQRTFTIDVTPVNDAPTQTIIPKQLARAGQSVGPIHFTVGDTAGETPAGSLTVTATSNNPKLLPPGSIILGGSGSDRTITIFPAGAQAGQADITVTVTDDGTGSPNGTTTASSSQTFDLTVNEAANPLYENLTGIEVIDNAKANPYPSTINVSGLQGDIAEVQVTLFGITHPQPDDLDVMLVGPGSTPVSVVLLSDAGDAIPLNNVTLRFRQSAGSQLSDNGQLASGDYLPTDFEPGDAFPSPAPSGAGTTLDAFQGKSANGTWSLYVSDDTAGPRGGIISSWQLSIRTRPVLAEIPMQVTQEDVAKRLTVAVGDNQPGVNFKVTYTKSGTPNVIDSIKTGDGTVIDAGGATIPGGNQTFTITPVADAWGTNTVTLTITDGTVSVSRTFDFGVTPVDDAPRFTGVSDKSTPAATPTSLDFSVVDPEGTKVNVVATSSREDVVPNANLVVSPANSTTAARNLIITPAGVSSGETIITLTGSDETGQKSSVTFKVTVTPNVSFVSSQPIVINDNTTASPYPAVLDVSGVNGTVSGASVVLVGFSHPYPSDVDVLLVAPDGRAVMLMSDAGAGQSVSNLRLTFADGGAALPSLSTDPALTSKTYAPANYVQVGELNEMPSPAPAAPSAGYSTSLSSLAGVNPNGQWKLYVRDDTFPDGGMIAGGWILLLQTAPTITQVGPQTTQEDTSLPIRFTVSDQDSSVDQLKIEASIQESGTGFNDPGLFPKLVAPPFDSPYLSLVTNSASFPNVSYTLTVLPATNAPINKTSATNAVTIKVTDLNGGSTATTTFLVKVLGVDDAPEIDGAYVPAASFNYATNRVVSAEDNSVTLQFKIKDADSELGTTNVVVESSNTALVPNSTDNIKVTGPNGQAAGTTFAVNVQVIPAANQNGTTTLTFKISDRTQTSTIQVALEVTPVNDSPTIAFPTLDATTPTISVGVGGTVTVPVTVGDVETAAQDITVTATSASDKQAIIPNANLVLGGRGADRTLTITAIGTVTVSTPVVVTVKADDNTGATTTKTFTVNVTPPPGKVFANTGNILIPATGSQGPASPYPSIIPVTGLIGNVSKISVSIDGLTHSVPDDIDMLLVSPSGKKSILMSDAGGRSSISNVQLIFDSTGRALPDEGTITTGTYQPVDYEPGVDSFPSTAPAGPYVASLAEFLGTNPNGNWSLYIVDDAGNDLGQITTGWSLRIETAPAISLVSGLNQPSGSPTFAQFAEDNAYTIQFSIDDPVTAPSDLAVSFASSNPDIIDTVTKNLVSTGTGNQATYSATIVPRVNAYGTNNLTIVVRRNDGAQSSIVVPMNITPVDDAPTISRLIDRSTPADTSLSIPLAVTDIEAGTLWISASSDNDAVIPDENVKIAGKTNLLKGVIYNASSPGAFPSGTLDTWTSSVTITPAAAAFGSANITIVATQVDKDGNAVQSSAPAIFKVTVNKVNHAPTLTGLPTLVPVEAGKSTTNIVFTVADSDNDSPLVVTGTSSNPSLVKDSDITITPSSGSAGDRTVAVRTQPGITGDVTINLRVTDPSDARGGGSFVVRLTPTRERVFANNSPITIRDNNSANPYPSAIDVSGFSGNVSRVTVTLNGFWHTYPDDVDILLVSPSGQKVILMSDAGGGAAVTSGAALNIKFDDTEPGAVFPPDNGPLTSTVYKVKNWVEGSGDSDDFVNRSPAGPAGPYSTALSAFNGFSPNGTWSLYIVDDTASDSGAITNGWSIGITTLPVLSGLSDVVSQEDVPARVPFTIAEEAFANPANFTFDVASSNPALVPSSPNNIVVSGTGTNRTVTIIPVANANTNLTGGATTITLTEQTTGVSASFKATFTAVNDAPTITPVQDQTVSAGTFVTVPDFNYSDVETPKKDLVISVTSSDPSIIPAGNVVVAGTNLRVFAGTKSGTARITITVQDNGDGVNAPQSSTVSFNVTVAAGFNAVAASESPITVNDNSRATPYPSTVAVSNVNGTVQKVTVTLTGVTHAFPDDVDVLLVGPNGQGVVLMSDAGAGGNPQTALNNAWLIFADEATDSLPDNSPIAPFNVYKPTNYEVSNSEFLAPAPAGPYATTLSAAFGNINPNGTWSLYVQDDASPDAGSIGGWVLNIALNEVGPTLTGLVDTNALEDAFVSIPFTVGSATLNDVTFTTSASNSNLVSAIKVGGSGADRNLQITLVPNASGTSQITVMAQDATGIRTRQFQLTVNPVDDPAVLGAISDVRVTGPYDLRLNITDIDTPMDQLIYQAAPGGVGLISDVQFIVANNQVTARIIPVQGARGTQSLTISVSDGSGQTSQTFNVTVVPPGPPQLGPIADVNTTRDTAATVALDVSDSDTPLSDLVFFASGEGAGVVGNVEFNLVGNTVNMTVTPAVGASGTETVTVSVSDGVDTATRMFQFTVGTAAPVIAAIGDQTTSEDTSITVPLTVTDADTALSDLVFFGSTDNPNLVRNITFITVGNSVSATIDLVPNANGTANITVTASDNSASASQTFRLNVTPVCEPPVIGSIAAQTSTGGSLTVTIPVTDPDDDLTNLVFNASAAGGSIVSGVTFDVTSSVVTATFTFVPNATGTEQVTVTASDGCSTGSQSFPITVSTSQPGGARVSAGLSNGNIVLTVSGTVGTTYVVEGSGDFRLWSAVGSVTIGADGTAQISLPAAGKARFFRIRSGSVQAPAASAYEGYDYTVGGDITTNSNGGTGWSAAWIPDAEGPSTNHVVRAGLGYVDITGKSLVTTGGSVYYTATNLTGGDIRSFRVLAQPETNGTTWVSFIGQRLGPTTNVPAANPYPRAANLSFYNNGTESFAIGNGSGAVSNLWSVLPAGSVGNVTNAQRTATPFNQQAFIVLRIDHNGGTTDNLYMWVNPPLGTEPSVATANAKSEGQFNFSFDRIRPFVGAEDAANKRPEAELALDEFRVGSSYASVTPYTERLDVTQPGNTTAVVNGTDTGAAPPAAEGVEHTIDNAGQKYLNFTKRGSGFVVTTAGSTLVTGIRLWTANDAVERDPASYKIEGSTSGAAGPFTTIAEGDLNLPSGRNAGGTTTALVGGYFQEVNFSNSTSYNAYRVTFPLVKNATTANSMQIAEVDLLGPVLP